MACCFTITDKDMAINTEEESGNLLLWILVWSELAAFGALTGAFIIAFALNPDAFAATRQHLQPQLAGLNTLILLASGWQAAVAASRHTALPGKRRALVVAGLLGFAFVGVKLHEYSTEIAFASDPAYGAFFELYFLLTGFHLLRRLRGRAAVSRRGLPKKRERHAGDDAVACHRSGLDRHFSHRLSGLTIMIHRTSRQLARSFAVLAILVLAGTAVVTSWKAALLPPVAVACLMLLFALMKSRRVIDDFLGFGEERGLLRTALLAWPAIFAAAALLRAFLQGILSL